MKYKVKDKVNINGVWHIIDAMNPEGNKIYVRDIGCMSECALTAIQRGHKPSRKSNEWLDSLEHVGARVGLSGLSPNDIEKINEAITQKYGPPRNYETHVYDGEKALEHGVEERDLVLYYSPTRGEFIWTVCLFSELVKGDIWRRFDASTPSEELKELANTYGQDF